MGWIEEVIEARHYAHAKAVYDRAEDKTTVTKKDPLMQLVEEIEYGHAKDLILRRRARMQKQKAGGDGG